MPSIALPEKVRDLYNECIRVHKQQRKYVYGGGHILLRLIKPRDGLDCSSSTSLVLSRHGMWPKKFHNTAIVSGTFSQWGEPGKGKYFTVWYSPTHVWIQFHGIGRYWRFDTSPWSDRSGRGPRMRLTPRTTRGFAPRHWNGL